MPHGVRHGPDLQPGAPISGSPYPGLPAVAGARGFEPRSMADLGMKYPAHSPERWKAPCVQVRPKTARPGTAVPCMRQIKQGPAVVDPRESNAVPGAARTRRAVNLRILAGRHRIRTGTVRRDTRAATTPSFPWPVAAGWAVPCTLLTHIWVECVRGLAFHDVSGSPVLRDMPSIASRVTVPWEDRESNPDYPVYSQALYQLSYPPECPQPAPLTRESLLGTNPVRGLGSRAALQTAVFPQRVWESNPRPRPAPGVLPPHSPVPNRTGRSPCQDHTRCGPRAPPPGRGLSDGTWRFPVSAGPPPVAAWGSNPHLGSKTPVLAGYTNRPAGSYPAFRSPVATGVRDPCGLAPLAPISAGAFLVGASSPGRIPFRPYGPSLGISPSRTLTLWGGKFSGSRACERSSSPRASCSTSRSSSPGRTRSRPHP